MEISENTFETTFEKTCELGDLKSVKVLLEKHKPSWFTKLFANSTEKWLETITNGFCVACKYGHSEIAKYLSEHYEVKNFDKGLLNACNGTVDQKTIDYLLTKQVDLEYMFIQACKKNFPKVIKALIRTYEIKKGVSLYYLCRYCDTDLVKEIVNDKELNLRFNYNSGLGAAIFFRESELIELMINKGANNFNEILIEACKNGNLDDAKYIIAKGANNFNCAINQAAKNNHFRIVGYLVGVISKKVSEGNKDIKLEKIEINGIVYSFNS